MWRPFVFLTFTVVAAKVRVNPVSRVFEEVEDEGSGAITREL